ncbi:MAG: Transcriptional regulator, effector binding domain protein [Candidatus Amesbacteria bacterium GW2011_GWA2_42_12]|uniref:Transcriptional regulator, effector binding domain protein n=1 Tax=Candidatus Amesbacteria bacterium GW2011_GWA2_42_12 TaxID=1618356 RepID=A0A0G0Y5L6_9BACT|nr:MAG: Transcriptional regulator, effector binding domain protein [Candidatus Amesbacteria bacterium GW2011_GWA2_42_12]
MQNNLLTVGEFASLAETTKRTVLWYEEKGILKPKQIDPENKYRLYEADQIIDFKAILLLRKLSFSLREIKNFLAKHNSPMTLFNLKKKSLKQQITDLENILIDTEKYYLNLQKTGTLVNPHVKSFKSFPVYYIDKLGPYHEIGDYFDELRSYFVHIPKGTQGLVIYEDTGYQPKNAKTKVCLLVRPGLKLKSGAVQIVKKMTVPGFKALSHTHYGSSKLLSMLWQELKKYRIKNDYQEDKDLPFEDLELSLNPHVTEMLMPVK